MSRRVGLTGSFVVPRAGHAAERHPGKTPFNDRNGRNPLLNRSAVVIGHESAFYGWLKTTGITDETIGERKVIADRTVYLIPACHYPEEVEEVVEDIFEEIFRRELRSWQPDATNWPDTADFDLFTRWFTVDGLATVGDVGRGTITEEV